MIWTTWIEIEPDDTPKETVNQLYRSTHDPATNSPPNLVRLNSLTPTVAGLLNRLRKAIHGSAKDLTEREQEIVPLIVASYNG